MKKIGLLMFFLHLFVNGQNNTLQNDLQLLEESILAKKELFHSFSKKKFSKQINQLKKDSLLKDLSYWKLTALLSQFKEVDLSIHTSIKAPLFKLKQFKNQFHVAHLPVDNYEFLGYQLVEINDLNLIKIKAKMEEKFKFTHSNQVDKWMVKYLGNVDFLSFIGINSAKEITLKLKNEETVKEIIILNEEVDLVQLELTKKAFYQRYDNRPFWQYGINFGQQIFFKLMASLTKEERIYLQDSLGLKSREIARLYLVSLQKVIGARSINYHKDKLVEKLNKKRYKKIFLDLRDFHHGTDFVFKSVLKNLLKDKRFRKKNRFYIFTNKNTSSSVIPLLTYLKKETKCIIIGTSVFGSPNSITQKEIVNLPSINSYLLIPKEIKKPILIIADETFETDFHQYKNGVDALLQKVLQ